MATGTAVVNLAITVVNAKGNTIPISISAAVLKDRQGKMVGGETTFLDLSLVEQLRRELHGRPSFQDIISKSPKMLLLDELRLALCQAETLWKIREICLKRGW